MRLERPNASASSKLRFDFPRTSTGWPSRKSLRSSEPSHEASARHALAVIARAPAEPAEALIAAFRNAPDASGFPAGRQAAPQLRLFGFPRRTSFRSASSRVLGFDSTVH